MENNDNPESSSKSKEQVDSTNTGNVVDMMLGKSKEKVIVKVLIMEQILLFNMQI